MLAFVLLVIPNVYENARSSEYDQRDYLKIALWIQSGGPFTDGNRNPLYPLLLSPLAVREIEFFTYAKFLSVGIGVLGLLIIIIVGRFHLGPAGGILLGAIMALNPEYLAVSGQVGVEVLLVPLFFAAWHATGRAIDLTMDANRRKRLLWATLGGGLTGLAYLGKGTGLLLTVSAAVSLSLKYRFRWIRFSTFWIYVFAFVLISLPLWFFNLIEYGNPLYNINTTHFMWLDSWEEGYVFDAADLPTAVSYVQNHSLGAIAERLFNGLMLAPRQWHNALRLVGMKENFQGVAQALSISALVMVGLAWLRARQTRAVQTMWFLLTTVGVGIFVILFSFYHPISFEYRFVMVWTPVVYLCLIWTISSFLGSTRHRYFETACLILSVVLAVIVITRNLGNADYVTKISGNDRQKNSEAIAMAKTIQEHSDPEENIAIGPTHDQAEWLLYDRKIVPVPLAEPNAWPKFGSWLAKNEVNLILLDAETWDRRQELFGNSWEKTNLGLSAETLPVGWQLLSPSEHPCDVCLYEFDRSIYEPATQTYFVFGELVELEGYSFDLDTPDSGAVTLVLHWSTLNRISELIHVFVHVIDDNGQIVAQHDIPLFSDFEYYPNSVFPKGTLVRSEHLLAPIASGEYDLFAGLYYFDNQQRIPISSGAMANETYLKLMNLSVP